mmetsp:Transcript_67740/g.105842  ORF Transcript_67740/g.105842 Transcript_67740/m.105842 type:complete len:176 (-) Transcript_67740:74-601(-)
MDSCLADYLMNAVEVNRKQQFRESLLPYQHDQKAATGMKTQFRQTSRSITRSFRKENTALSYIKDPALQKPQLDNYFCSPTWKPLCDKSPPGGLHHPKEKNSTTPTTPTTTSGPLPFSSSCWTSGSCKNQNEGASSVSDTHLQGLGWRQGGSSLLKLSADCVSEHPEEKRTRERW